MGALRAMNIGDNSKAQLQNLVDRIEAVELEMDSLKEDRKEIFLEAKNQGLDLKALRAVLRIRKQNSTERETHESIVAQYMSALGMLGTTPLGQAAIHRATGA